MYIIKTFYCLIISAILSVLLPSCVNSINVEEEEEDIPVGTLPIKIESDALQKQIYNKDQETSVGLFAIVSTSSLDEQRHVDNHKMVCNSNGFTSVNPIYYPSGKIKTDLISYHPFQSNGIKENTFAMDVAVELNQGSLLSYNASDFMIAFANNITPSSKTVSLKHEHQFSQLNISIKIQDDTGPEFIRSLNPKVIVNGIYTQATFHFDNRGYTNYNTSSSLIPYGIWSISNNKLIGKKCLIIPQTVSSSINFLTVIIGEETYLVKLSDSYKFTNGSSSEMVILYSSKGGVGDVTAEINDWIEGDSNEIVTEEKIRFTKLRHGDFDFNKTSIYHVVYDDRIVAQVCKEFLSNESISQSCVVVYPVTNGEVDLENGRVWSILGESNQLLGGTVVWDKKNNSFDYRVGSSLELPYLYFDAMGNILFEEPESCLKVSLEGKFCVDIRHTESTEYPIIKIGTQYWLGKELQTKYYNTGASIPYKTGSGYAKKSAGYFYTNTSFFYNKAAVVTGSLAPIGWHVADYHDWELLKMYLNGESSFIKSVDAWQDGSIAPNNLTGFSAQPVGLFNKLSNKDESAYAFKGQYVAYWMMGINEKTVAEKAVLINLGSNEIKDGNYTDYSGFCIRCVQN